MTDNGKYKSRTNKFMTGISISQEEKAIVDSLKDKLEISFSKTLGNIIREWAEMRSGYIAVPIEGTVKDGQITFNKFWLTKEGMKEAAERG